MKKSLLILALLLLTAPLAAQHMLGVRGGYGYGSVRFFPPQETKSLWGLYSGGISWKYYSKERVLGGLQVDLLYLQRGYREPRPNTSTYIRQINTLQLPLFMQPHVYFGGRRVRIFLNAGIYLSYNLSSTYSILYPEGTINEETHNAKYEFMDVRDNRFSYGLVGGFGFNYILGRLELLAEARYDYGYGDILKNTNKYPGNPRRSPLDAAYIHIGAYWRLGKGGFLSPLSPKSAARLAQREQQRAERRQNRDR